MQAMGLNGLEQGLIFAVLGTAVIALIYAGLLARQILAHSKGTEDMQAIWRDIKAGATAYLNTQFRAIAPLIVVLTVAMFFSVYLVTPTREARELLGPNANAIVAIARAGAFLMGATFSLLVGRIGMSMAVEGNVRVAEASNHGYNEALTVAYRSGTITGMLTDGLGLLGGTLIFIIFGKASPDVLLGFGFGGTLLALFMRVGGGIFTKAADVGADLVGKVEAGMEEDDPRNAAVIADLVGDNVGDCAGMAADIFESYEVTIVASLILGLTLTAMTGNIHWIIIPLLIRGVGVISTIIGTFAVSLWKTDDAENAMFMSYELSSVITIVAAIALSYVFAPGHDLRMGILVAVGVALAVAFNPLTAFATSANSPRVQAISAASVYGPALVILEGMTLGYLSSVWAVFMIIAALGLAVLAFSVALPAALVPLVIPVAVVAALALFIWRGVMKKNIMEGVFFAMWAIVGGLFLISMKPVDITGLAPAIQGLPLTQSFANFAFVLFGVSLIGVGMLSLTGNNVSMDAFGPISDNANGIGEVANMPAPARQIMADLDAAGNTTKAITKGVAIASAVIAALSLYGSFYTDILRVLPADRLANFDISQLSLDLSRPIVFIGLLIGGALPLLFGGLLIKAVNRSAQQIMAEVRRQLRIPEIWAGTKRPEYAHAVQISTRAAQAELIPIGVIAVFAPIVVGLLLHELALGGFLAGVILSGQLLAVFMANAGGAWDNAKKYVEDGHYGGKRTSNHAATVVGDTVGDPLKDTAGPALNPMIKVMNLVALIMAPIVVQYPNLNWITGTIVVIGIVLIIWAVRRSDRPNPMVEGEASQTFEASQAAAD